MSLVHPLWDAPLHGGRHIEVSQAMVGCTLTYRPEAPLLRLGAAFCAAT
jgi:hypothetical protein